MKNKEKELIFENIYAETSDMVYNVALRLTADTYLAEEAVQEVYLKIFKNLDSFKNRSSIKTWIYRITINTAINLAKARSRYLKTHTVIDEESMVHLVNPKDNVEKTAEDMAKEELIKKILASLNPKYRSYIILRDMEGLSYDEISKIFGKNINTVRTCIKRAREKLIELFSREADFHELQKI